MRGVILAGGTGSRLLPLTKVINKHLLPVGKYPMIYYAIHKLRLAGIKDILIVSSAIHLGSIVSLLENGDTLGVKITYKVQNSAGGIAQALALAEDFVKGVPMTVILGDNIFIDDLTPHVKRFEKQGEGAMVLLKDVEDPSRYGVATIEKGTITSIEEKPNNPKSHYAVTGIYMYDSRVFEVIRSLKPSPRGELEITDVNKDYLSKRKLLFDFLRGWWVDAGTPTSLFHANEWAKELDLKIEGDRVQ